MRLILLILLFGMSAPDPARVASRPTLAAAPELQSRLRDALMNKLKSMSDSDHGVFHEEVTPIVAPSFPAGQTFAETERVLAGQKLGPLRRFHGKTDNAGIITYVSHSDLMSETYSDVSLVIDFDFSGETEHDMTLKKVNAFLQAASM